MISAIHLFDEHTPQPIPPVNDDDDDDDDKVKPGSGGGNIDPDDDEGGSDHDDDEEDETLWTGEDVQWQRMMWEWSICAIVRLARRSVSHKHQT